MINDFNKGTHKFKKRKLGISICKLAAAINGKAVVLHISKTTTLKYMNVVSITIF